VRAAAFAALTKRSERDEYEEDMFAGGLPAGNGAPEGADMLMLECLEKVATLSLSLFLSFSLCTHAITRTHARRVATFAMTTID
jgi:hypothetical protein